MPSDTDDTSAMLDAWNQLDSVSGHRLIERAASLEVAAAADIERFRREWPASVVSAAVELVMARRRAAAKFERASELWCDVSGVEQATSQRVGEWKTRRFLEQGVDSVLDLCCGIGGDAMAFSSSCEVHAVDLDPLRCWMAARNAGCSTSAEDVTGIDPRGRYVHVDPARRDEASGRRSWNPDHHRPRWSEVSELLGRSQGAACKLGPGIPLPLEGAPESTEYELIQDSGQLVQAVLWTGELAHEPGLHRATMLPEGRSVCGAPGSVRISSALPESGGWLIEARPALERAGVVAHQLGDRTDVGELSAGLGLMSSTTPVSDPWFTDWRIEAVLPLRERPLKRWLRAHDAGDVVVRTRGKTVNPDTWSKSLRGTGATPWVLFALRVGTTTRAIVTHPAG